ncbi:UTRA domain-containing protein [Micromonospora sp. NBC_01813]|uniref:UTRA domain-containing protein n=1 Tax=Micromonospora sp. NBC_01813 TaxID=2975988 RepID=UPI002DD89EBA|nr:UTRA domain-containing protein [Micromonospora sp. NBC_01813]WSA09452.1 UTRA domain-containing protein [Micromonospora sp. NBC_01813]
MVVVDPDFVRLMRRLRQEHGMSFRDLAKKAYFSRSYLCEVENGKKPPSLHLAKALDVCLNAEGQLTRLVTAGPDDQEREFPFRSAASGDCPDRDVEAWLTRSTWPAQLGGSTPVSASQWAQVATMLYDVFVRSRPPLLRLGPDRYANPSQRERNLTPFAAEATMQGRTPRVECRAVSRQQAPSDVAALLSLDLGDTVVLRENRYLVDGQPVQLGHTYLPTSVVGTSTLATELNLGPGGTFAALERLGYRTARIREQVTTRFPTRDEAEALKLPPGVPVIVLLHASYDNDGFPFEATRYILRSDAMAVQYVAQVAA